MSNPAQTSPPPSAGPGVWKSILMLTPTLSLVFSAAFISAQFPSVTYALALQVGGTNMMMITCLLTLLVTGSTLLSLLLLYGDESSDDNLILVAVGSGFVFVIVLLIGFFIQMTRLDHIGMYDWWRMSDAETVVGRAEKENATSLDHPDNQVFVRAIHDPTPAHIYRAHQYSKHVVAEQSYRDAMAAAAIIGLSNTKGYQNALARGWLWEEEVQAWGIHLRKHPPHLEKAEETKLAAYLQLTQSTIKKD